MTLRFYNYKCPKCGFKKESLEKIGTDELHVDCVSDDYLRCALVRQISIPKTVKIDVEAKTFVPMHTKRARALGHGGSTEKSIGRYDNDDPKTYKRKILVGCGKQHGRLNYGAGVLLWIAAIALMVAIFASLQGCASQGWVMDEVSIGGTRNIGSDNYGDNYQDKGISATFTWRRYWEDEPREEKK